MNHRATIHDRPMTTTGALADDRRSGAPSERRAATGERN